MTTTRTVDDHLTAWLADAIARGAEPLTHVCRQLARELETGDARPAEAAQLLTAAVAAMPPTPATTVPANLAALAEQVRAAEPGLQPHERSRRPGHDDRHGPCPPMPGHRDPPRPGAPKELTCRRTRKSGGYPSGTWSRPTGTHARRRRRRKPCASSKRPWGRMGSSRTSWCVPTGRREDLPGRRRRPAAPRPPGPGEEAPGQVPHHDADTVPGDARTMRSTKRSARPRTWCA